MGANNSQLASATGTTNTLTYISAAATDVTVTINVTANYAEDGNISKTADVTLIQGICATPTITQNDNQITFKCSYPASGVTVYYTTDGTTPSSSNGTPVAAGATVTVPYGTTVKAIATASGYDDSGVVEYLMADKPSGSGTQADPYIISSPSHMNDFAEMVDNGYAGKYYKVAANISVSGYTAPNTAFTDNFDGGFFIIDGLTQPLVKSANDATIKNVFLDNVSLNSSISVSGTTCLGAIAAYASGSTKIYNCGVQASGSTFDEKGNLVNSSSTISDNDNTGSLLGYITGNVRVVNNYSYANVSSGQYVGGIVGRNYGTALTKDNVTNTSHCAIANNMFYGDLRGSGNVSPVYAGNHTSNVQNVNEYNYWRSRSNVSYNNYNNQLAVDKDAFLTRFPFYRHILNTRRELAAIYLFGNRTDANVAEVDHWYNTKNKPDGLGGIDNPTPYPIIENWLTNTKRTTEDIKNNLPNTGKEYEGNLITAADRSDKTVGSNGYLRINWTVHGKSGSIDLPITDMDSLNYDFTWGKIVLPFATELAEKNTYAEFCTGWKITGNTDGTPGFLTNFNFADRDCTTKDLYSNSNYIFAQDGNYVVPYGLTAITIEGNMAKAFYLRVASYDVGYVASYANATALAGTISGNYHGQTVYTNLNTLITALSPTTDPLAQAIILVGNFHYNQNTNTNKSPYFNTGKAVSIMSVDEDNNQEPDYGWYSYHTTDRTGIPPMRFDFVPNIGIGMAARTTGSTPYPTIGIWHSRGWFELTETCVSMMSECEINDRLFTSASNTDVNNRWIVNSGYFIQIVRCREGNCGRLAYLQIGGNAYVEQLYPGSHTDNANTTTLCPIVVNGGEIEECYMTGYKAGASATGSNIYFWSAGGRIHKWLGAYVENPSTNGVNVTAKVDHAVIRRFFGGGTSTSARITGNIDITMNNSLVDFYCGGPEFGDMESGKTVTTHAKGSTFGEFYGGGFGGTSITINREGNNGGVSFANDATYPLAFTYYTNHRLQNETYGIGVNYDFEYILYAGGSGSGVARFYTGYANYSLAQTGNVTNVLENCTVLHDYFGGGCQGKVAGTVTSTLTNCDIKGSAFGGGFKPAETTVDVYPTTQPTYSTYKKETGLFSDFGTVSPETFKWVYRTTTGADAGKKELYTTVNMTESGQVTGDICITLKGGNVAGNVFGGGNESASLKKTNVIIDNATIISNDVYGGANQANVGNDSEVNILSGTANNVYGANNVSGTKSGAVTVNINGATAVVNNDVFGGGNLADYGGSPVVNILNGTVKGATYGGGALADVTGNTTVNLFGGTVHDVYGGGLGRIASDGITAVAAEVGGNTLVTLGQKNADNSYSSSIVTGSIFGCNNANGTPKGLAKVHILHTMPKGTDGEKYHVAAVYGGGNQAAYMPTANDAFAEVLIETCDNKIEYVYGGGNAASTPATKVTIEGGEMYYVFGGGNGAGSGNPGADVGYKDYIWDDAHRYGLGTTEVNIKGGIINTVFGGSNTKGNIRISTNVKVEQEGDCTLDVKEIYGAGNEAEMYGSGNVTIGCTPGFAAIYGGANKADIRGDVSLTVTNGTLGKVFGGNNLSGKIMGSITLNIDETGCKPIIIGNLYGGGNLAPYSVYGYNDDGTAITSGTRLYDHPQVNIISATSIGNVYGGGFGQTAIVAGDPHVNVNMIKGEYAGKTILKENYLALNNEGNLVTPAEDLVIPDAVGTIGNIYGGGEMAAVEGNTYVNICTVAEQAHVSGNDQTTKYNTDANIIGDVFGGGKGKIDGATITYANISGNTNVSIGGGTFAFPANGIDPSVNHNVYGGGNVACVVGGNTTVDLKAGLLPAGFFEGDTESPWKKYQTAVSNQTDNVMQGSVFGGGYGVHTTVTGSTTVNVNVADAAVNKSIVDVVGGSYNGLVGSTNVTVASGNIYKVYGGGLGSYEGYNEAPDAMKETIGSVGTATTVDGVTTYNGSTNVTINGGKIYDNIFGGGAGLKYQGTSGYLHVAEVNGTSNVVIDAIAGWKDEASAYKHKIYGGGALGLVNDEILVEVKSGIMEGAEVFAGSLGEEGHLDKAMVTKGAAVHTLANATSGDLGGHFNIYGGCDMAQMEGDTDVDIKHGTFSGSIFGAGKGLDSKYDADGNLVDEYLLYGKVTGNTAIEIDAPNVILGNKNAISDDGTKIINKNDIIKIYGGGALGLVEGKINPVTLKSGKLYGEVFGGSLGELGHPNKAKITLTDGDTLGVKTMANGLPAGALEGKIHIYGGCDMAVVEGNTKVEITHGSFTGQMFGGGKGLESSFDAEGKDLYADHGKVQGRTTIIYNNEGDFNGNVYGGGALGTVDPRTNSTDAVPTTGYTTQIILKKGILNGQVFGGGYGEKANVDKAKVVGNTLVTTRQRDNAADVLSGDMNHIYGGGDMAMVDGSTNLDFTRGKFNGEIFGGGHGVASDATNEYMDWGKVTGSTNVIIDGGELGEADNPNLSEKENDKRKIRIYGGGALGLVGTGVKGTGINIVVKSGTHYGEIFGGSLGEEGHPNKAKVDGDSHVSTEANSNGDALGGNIKFYGGCNRSQVTGNSSVVINHGTFAGAVFGGGKGISGFDENHAVDNVYGKIFGDASVLIKGGNSRADVYGGCALGIVGGNTTVDLAGGAVRNVYGGGLGEIDDPTTDTIDETTAALVMGDATVTLNGSIVDGVANDCKVYGSIFGCNNVNGTPKGHAKVHVLKTVIRDGQDTTVGNQNVADAIASYHVAEVYGGGNQAAYIPSNTNDYTEVLIENCDNSIAYVYGGGNAAPVPATQVTVIGANAIDYVFGGGNGKGANNDGADVGYLGYYSKGSRTEYGKGTATTIINGGTIHNVYGGSNTLGYIRTKASVSVEKEGDCPLNVTNVFAAGNEAEMFCDGELTIGCIDGEMKEIYGGANNADIHGSIVMNLTNGSIQKVFGGNNVGGNIEGSITVNIDETGCKPINIGELYCCGNQAAYSIYGYKDGGQGKFVPRTKEEFDALTAEQKAAAGFTDGKPKADPTLNIISFTSIGSVFGGGLGVKAAVYGNTNININPIPGKYAAAMTTNEKYGINNDNNNYSQSQSALPENKWYTTDNHGLIGNVYGGGSEAMVYGNTNITIGSLEHNSHVTGGDALTAKTYDVGINITGNIYGGGKKAKVTGDTNVKIGK